MLVQTFPSFRFLESFLGLFQPCGKEAESKVLSPGTGGKHDPNPKVGLP